ncbi:uncharacterized protein (TIGR03086 family) [Pseudonocardia hierapolitana]|uniref:Uncharacterized protein (TIGR03086 family) n=1 Tax=Pseudonocardia hierapolitana TaxID=1128676 RepID=A0A561SWB1_9PSEU|nr:TIGR03086 family metal-binding protein [Pseudonocardia hierapolitana]TWF79147.1 uncharacterized protein (TIGR03086 family) [Pseudonocardia hierapolitana]
MTTLDARELYRRASAEFTARVHRVGDRWTAPTPCAGWDVRALVRHLVEEERWAPPLLDGATIAEVGDRFAGDLLGADPVAAVDDAAPRAVSAVESGEALTRTVHLSFGDVPGQEYVMQLAADHLVHAWDLGQALGDDSALDADAVATVREWFASIEPLYRRVGVIGPRAALPDAAGPQDELLAMFGRSPALAAVQRFNAAFGAKDVDAIMAAMTPDCVFEDTTAPDGTRHVGAAAVRSAWTSLFTGAPDARFTVEEIVPAGDRVVSGGATSGATGTSGAWTCSRCGTDGSRRSCPT